MSAEWAVLIRVGDRELTWPCADEAEARRMYVRAVNRNKFAAEVIRIVTRQVTEWTAPDEDFGPGCDCTELCEMGPTCPGGMLAGIDASGCWRTNGTCPTACVEQNHPGREHEEWFTTLPADRTDHAALSDAAPEGGGTDG